ncbi:Origin recognition complex subunit 2 [Camponotus floridanus]|uniref:Origin recognition complex subunit 2 n=1 Tax=Camponotus floridanus TaxID=104421 RepID=E2A2L2_CAMFO|nr:Origin recognition complex subunit 2 [Camponotus floridanus]
MTSPRNLRRSTRIKAIVKYTEDSFEENHDNSHSVYFIAPIDTVETEVEKQLEDIKENVQKPLELFSEKDISGRKLYTFQTPTKKNSMMLKANQCRTSKTPKNTKTLPTLKIVLEKISVASLKNKNLESGTENIKMKIISRKRRSSSVSSTSESVSEDSEYIPTDLEISSESDEKSNESKDNENSDESEEENNIRRRGKQSILQKSLPKREVQSTPRRTKRECKSIVYKEYILDNIIVNLLGLDCPTNSSDCLKLIEKILKSNPDDRLYLIIHNIDGIMLRSSKAQNILAGLATISNVRIIASVDHINAPLLWDHIKRAKFNFYWWDATTFLPYQAETAFESSLLVQQSGGLALSSLQNVFLSLTSNARAIYLILVKYQLNNSSSNFTGMLFKDLYRAAREQFLVSSDLALRAQLTEFVDHKLVRTKRAFDGAEYLIVPLDKGLLKQFVEQHGS